MNGNIRYIIFSMVPMIYIELFGCYKVMIGRKGRPVTWRDTTSWLLMMITLRRMREFVLISDSAWSVEKRVHIRLNDNPMIVRKDEHPIDIVIIGVIDRVLIKMMLMNFPFPLFNM